MGLYEVGVFLVCVAGAQGVRWLQRWHETTRYKKVATAVDEAAEDAVAKAENLVHFTRKKYKKGGQVGWSYQQLGRALETVGALEEALTAYRESYVTYAESARSWEAAHAQEREANITLPEAPINFTGMTYALKRSASLLSQLGQFAEAHADLSRAEALLRRADLSAAESALDDERTDDDAVIAGVLLERSHVARRERDHLQQVRLLRRLVAATSKEHVGTGPYRSSVRAGEAPVPSSLDSEPGDFRDPSIEPRLELASALFTIGEGAEARRLEESCLLHADGEESWRTFACDRYLDDRNYQQAARLSKDAISNGVGTPEDYLNVLIAEPSHVRAMETAKKARDELGPDDASRDMFQSVIAACCFALDRLDEGLAYEPAAHSYPSLLASAKWRAGETTEATKLIEEAANRPPSMRDTNPARAAITAGFWHLERGQMRLARHASEVASSKANAPFTEWDRCTITVLSAHMRMHEGALDESRALLLKEGNTACVASLGELAHTNGMFDLATGHYASAAAHFTKAIEFHEWSSRWLDSRFIAYRGLRGAYVVSRQWQEAADIHVRITRFPLNSSDGAALVQDCSYRAAVDLQGNDPGSALKNTREAITTARLHYGAESIYLPELYALESDCLRATSEASGALAAAQRATKLASKLWGDEHILMALPQQSLGRASLALERNRDARAAFAHALRLMEVSQHDRLSEVEANLAGIEQ